MGLPRSTYYDTPATEADTEIVARITAICEEFEAYGPTCRGRATPSGDRRQR